MENVDERPLCKCHGEPMQKNGRWFACAVKRRAYYAAVTSRSPVEMARRRAYYDRRQEELREYTRNYYKANRASRLAYAKARDEKNIARGICISCVKEPPATATSTRCNACLDAMITPLQLLKRRRVHGLKRMAARAAARAA